jgi:nitrate reductase assembly molybdenum cofactor insertion protein NarJ
MPAYISTRIRVGDYDRWRAMFDKDAPRAREKATDVRVFRAVEEPDHVIILLEFASAEDAQEARGRLLGSGVLDRFADRQDPIVLEET